MDFHALVTPVPTPAPQTAAAGLSATSQPVAPTPTPAPPAPTPTPATPSGTGTGTTLVAAGSSTAGSSLASQPAGTSRSSSPATFIPGPTPTPAPPAPTPTPGTPIPGISRQLQSTSEDCETAALAMILEHEGIDDSQSYLLSLENVVAPASIYSSNGRVVSSGDPYTSFVGNPNGSPDTLSSGGYGYGTYYPNLSNVAKQAGGTVIYAGQGLSAASLYADIASGHPAVAWVNNTGSSFVNYGTFSVTAADGQSVPYPNRYYEHAIAVIGVNSTQVYILNPWGSGPEGWISQSYFQNTWATFSNMAVVIS